MFLLKYLCHKNINKIVSTLHRSIFTDKNRIDERPKEKNGLINLYKNIRDALHSADASYQLQEKPRNTITIINHMNIYLSKLQHMIGGLV